MPTATVKLQGPDGMPKVHCAVGTGPVDAAYKAVDMALQLPVELTSYTMDVSASFALSLPPSPLTATRGAGE